METRRIEDLYGNLVEEIYLRNYFDKGTLQADRELTMANEYIKDNELEITKENYEEIREELLKYIDSTEISLN